MSKQKEESLENNTTEKRYSEHLCVSKTVKKFTVVNCVKKFLEINPELEGTKITHNQIQTALIKSYLGIFVLKNGNKHNNNSIH